MNVARRPSKQTKQTTLMKTLLIAILALTCSALITPEAQARDRHHHHSDRHHYRHHHHHHYRSDYHHHYRTRSYYRPARSYYYSSYRDTSCYPRTYYRRPGISVRFGF